MHPSIHASLLASWYLRPGRILSWPTLADVGSPVQSITETCTVPLVVTEDPTIILIFLVLMHNEEGKRKSSFSTFDGTVKLYEDGIDQWL
jgi:hypothetical protein